MSNTPNHAIPYVPEGTLDPAAGLNISLDVIDALLQLHVISIGDAAPPGSPADGDLYIVGEGATGDWAGLDNRLVRWVAEGAYWKSYVAGSQVVLALNDADGELYKWATDSSDGGWVLAAGAGISDAPSDGTTYGRKDGAWEPVAGAFSISGSDSSDDVVFPCESIVFSGPVQVTDLGGGIAGVEVTADRKTVSAVTNAGGTVTLNYDHGDYFTHTMTADVTTLAFANLPGAGKGATLMLRITQDSTPRTFAWPASFKWAGGAAGTISTGSGDVDVLAITTFDNGTTWIATLAQEFA